MSSNNINIIENLLEFFTSKEFFIAIIGGAIGTYFAPWTKWKFEKEKIRLENRKAKITHWREELNKVTSLSDFYNTPLYNELSEFIPKEELTKIMSNNAVEVNVGIGITLRDSRVIARFYKAISDTEKKWSIV